MHTGEHDVLHRIELGTVPAGTYWHVYPAAFAATSSNPNSKARLAWRDGSHGMFYGADTAAAALWETALRFASVSNGRVYTDQRHLQNWILARLTLKVDVPVIDLRPPHRRAVVDAHSDLDAMWDVVLKTPHHEETHDVAARLMRQLADAGYDTGTALRWHSRQAGTESVILFSNRRCYRPGGRTRRATSAVSTNRPDRSRSASHFHRRDLPGVAPRRVPASNCRLTTCLKRISSLSATKQSNQKVLEHPLLAAVLEDPDHGHQRSLLSMVCEVEVTTLQ
ncbi:RES domain-containing protein [Paraburkholderia lacunae]|nr:RES domain-containing protein [Paraburkholderia lacunae]